MPQYRVKLSDGRTVLVEAPAPPSEADVLGALGQTPEPPPSPTAVRDRLVQANETPLEEPTTYGGGFLRSMGDTAARTGLSVLKSPLTLAQGGLENLRQRSNAPGGFDVMGPGTPPLAEQLSALSTPEGGGTAIGALLLPKVGQAVPPLARSAAPMAGRAVKTGAGAALGGIKNAPIIGAPVRGAIRGGLEAWRASAPPPTPVSPAVPRTMSPLVSQAAPPTGAPVAMPSAAAAPMGPAPKPKLTVQQTAEYLRGNHGSDRAARMLYGPTQKQAPNSAFANAGERQAAIKRLAPGESQLPKAAQQKIDATLAKATPDEAFQYAQAAPNARAQSYFGRLLREALFDRLSGSK